MIGNISRIPAPVRTALHRDPSTIHAVLYPDWAEVSVKPPGLLARLFGRKPAPIDPPSDPIHTLSDSDTIDLDKTWHILHFLFTGSDWGGDFPHGFLVSCGKPVGDEDVGYGPARSFDPSQVKQIASFLASLDHPELRKRLDPGQLEKWEIYPGLAGNPTELEENWDYIANRLDEITRFLAETAEKDFSILVYIN